MSMSADARAALDDGDEKVDTPTGAAAEESASRFSFMPRQASGLAGGKTRTGGGYASFTRGLKCSEADLKRLSEAQMHLRERLVEQVAPMLERWLRAALRDRAMGLHAPYMRTSLTGTRTTATTSSMPRQSPPFKWPRSS
mmetsp:Transcript_70627/g.197291  ORF Transcript_70627/g.197291 Transcript_70627/m.197291 type:complete len:140 (-) Transcript_70627:1207-1626(-)